VRTSFTSAHRRLRRRQRQQGAALAGVVVGLAVLAGTTACSGGSGSPGDPLSGTSANQITTEAFANLKSVSSVHVAGQMSNGGQPETINVTLGATDCQGTFTTQAKGAYSILTVNGATYFIAGQTFWKTSGASGSSLTLLTGKYLKVGPNKSTLAALGAMCHPSQLAGYNGTITGMVNHGITTFNGQKALHITDSGDAAGIYVTDTSTPELLHMTASSTDLTFSNFNAPLNLTAPPANQTLDGKKYGF
jgi:hypothetical protein